MTLMSADGGEISCHPLILALNGAWKRLDVPGLARSIGNACGVTRERRSHP